MSKPTPVYLIDSFGNEVRYYKPEEVDKYINKHEKEIEAYQEMKKCNWENQKRITSLEEKVNLIDEERKIFATQYEDYLEKYSDLVIENEGLKEKVIKIQQQIDRHKTWTGQNWKQNPLASFVAEKITAIIKGDK